MASKYSEGKSGRGDEDQDLLDLVQEFCMSDGFEQEFEMFAKEHAHVFQRSLQFSVHSGEHPLEFHDVYHKYLTKFEGLIEDFIVKVNESYVFTHPSITHNSSLPRRTVTRSKTSIISVKRSLKKMKFLDERNSSSRRC